MTKVTEKEKQLLRLILRSEANSEGWVKVSAMLFPLFKNFMRPELVEFNEPELMIKPTAEGTTLLKYL